MLPVTTECRHFVGFDVFHAARQMVSYLEKMSFMFHHSWVDGPSEFIRDYESNYGTVRPNFLRSSYSEVLFGVNSSFFVL